MKNALLMLCLALTVPAAAQELPKFSAGVLQSFGTDKYRGTDVYAGAGLGGFNIAPEFRHFSETGAGSHSVGSARLGWDSRWFGFGVTGGYMPKALHSNASFAGADVAFTLSPMGEGGIRRIGGPGRGGAPVGKGIARIDFGAGAMFTRHHTDGAVNVTQGEYNAFGGASVFGFLASARFAKFSYNKDLKTTNAAAPVWTPIQGHLRYDNGFADFSSNLGVEAPFFPMVTPFANYTLTKYKEFATSATTKTKPGDTKTYTVGARVGLEMVGLDAEYQIEKVTASKDRTYTGIGASIRL